MHAQRVRLGRPMTLRLGFVGVGRWARKLAESFRACGAEVWAFDRGSFARPQCSGQHNLDSCKACAERWIDGFGRYMPWRDQLADKNIDAIIAVAPPEITTQIALACAEAGKAVMATKPLFDHPTTIRAPFYVDFFRLWSDAHKAAKDHGGSINYVFEGSGPIRSFPGSLDYGPHVVAVMLDLWEFDTPQLQHARVLCLGEAENVQATWAIHSKRRGATFTAHFGNAGTPGARRLDLLSSGPPAHIYETPTHIGSQLKSDVLKAFCQSFLNDVSEGFVSTTLLNYSREGMRMLNEIRAKAT
jgi:hypothetical protein